MDNVRTGKLIAELRKKQGMTQQQLADKLYLSKLRMIQSKKEKVHHGELSLFYCSIISVTT